MVTVTARLIAAEHLPRLRSGFGVIWLGLGVRVRVRVKLLTSWLLCRALEFRVGLELGLGLAFDVGHLPPEHLCPGRSGGRCRGAANVLRQTADQ